MFSGNTGSSRRTSLTLDGHIHRVLGRCVLNFHLLLFGAGPVDRSKNPARPS